MQKQHVMTALNWLRQMSPGTELMLYGLLCEGFVEQYQVLNNEAHSRILCDLVDFELHGTIPIYLARKVRRLYSEEFTVPQPQPEGDVLCKSEAA